MFIMFPSSIVSINYLFSFIQETGWLFVLFLDIIMTMQFFLSLMLLYKNVFFIYLLPIVTYIILASELALREEMILNMFSCKS